MPNKSGERGERIMKFNEIEMAELKRWRSQLIGEHEQLSLELKNREEEIKKMKLRYRLTETLPKSVRERYIGEIAEGIKQKEEELAKVQEEKSVRLKDIEEFVKAIDRCLNK